MPTDEEAVETKPRLKKRRKLPNHYVVCEGVIGDYRRIAKTLAVAFFDDPFVNYILKTETASLSHKRKLFNAYFEYSVFECFALNGKVWVVKDLEYEATLVGKPTRVHGGFVAAICWYQVLGNDPDGEFVPFAQNVRLLLFYKYEMATWWYKCRKRLNKLLDLLYEIRVRMLDQVRLQQESTIWYLNDLGCCVPGKGIGGYLIEHTMGLLKDKNVGYYLELSNVENRNFYCNRGFEPVASYSVREGRAVDYLVVNREMVVVDAMICV